MSKTSVLEPGATAGDPLPRAAVPTVIAVAAAATYPRLSAGLDTPFL